MSKAEDLLKAQNKKTRILPKRTALEPTRTVLNNESTTSQDNEIPLDSPKKLKESIPQSQVDEVNNIKENKPPKNSKNKKITTPSLDSQVGKKGGKNEGTITISVKFLTSADQDFFNAQAVIKGIAKWQYIKELVDKDLKESINRSDEFHKTIKLSDMGKAATIPVTEETKEIMIRQAAMHSFKGISIYVAYLVYKERMNTPDWN